MTRLLAICSFAVLAVSAAPADAQRYKDAGTRGTVTAYEEDGTTVLDHRVCLRSGRTSYDYVRCGSRLRDSVKIALCGRRGAGTHHYYYQIGDGRPVRSSVFCRRY